MSKDDFNNSVLVGAATNKHPDVFEAVLSGVEKGLTPQEVRDNAAFNYICHKHVRGSDTSFAS